jgi:hypothetical protein
MGDNGDGGSTGPTFAALFIFHPAVVDKMQSAAIRQFDQFHSKADAPVPRQLDILALEPYFGGIRRNMLETLVHTSRHRWTLLTLPPRRMERRLAAAAHWFAEQIARRDIGPTDLLFTCDALNLADLYRLCPAVANQPSVVYFHCNSLPDPPDPSNPELKQPLDLTHLNTATAASEIWFNSRYHARSFMEGVEGLVENHAELQSRNPLEDLRAKLAHVPPPVDSGRFVELAAQSGGGFTGRVDRLTPGRLDVMPDGALDGVLDGVPDGERDPSLVFLETRDANMELLNAALALVHQQRRKMTLLVSGPVDQLSNLFPRQVISETDPVSQVRGLLAAGTFISAKIAIPFDENAVRAMQLGCRLVLPHTGVYPELLSERLHQQVLYDMSAESLASHLSEALYGLPMQHQKELASRLESFDPIKACAVIDDRLDALVGNYVAAEPRTAQRRSKLVAR